MERHSIEELKLRVEYWLCWTWWEIGGWVLINQRNQWKWKKNMWHLNAAVGEQLSNDFYEGIDINKSIDDEN